LGVSSRAGGYVTIEGSKKSLREEVGARWRLRMFHILCGQHFNEDGVRKGGKNIGEMPLHLAKGRVLPEKEGGKGTV